MVCLVSRWLFPAGPRFQRPGCALPAEGHSRSTLAFRSAKTRGNCHLIFSQIFISPARDPFLLSSRGWALSALSLSIHRTLFFCTATLHLTASAFLFSMPHWAHHR